VRYGEQVPHEVNDWWHVAVAVTKGEHRRGEKRRIEERRGENERGRFRE